MSQPDFSQKFPFMTPVKSAPSLGRVNGCGVGLYGHRDDDSETKSYVATWCISILFIPCFCLRAYRVVRAQRGWYFLGREPLSPFAKVWNLLLLVAILSTVGVVSYDSYTSSPAYKARQQMVAARAQVDAGHLGAAAVIYQGLAAAGADESANAAAALKDLVDNQCPKAPLGESPEVFSAAAVVAHRAMGMSVTEVADKGLKLVADRGNTDPAAGVHVLDAIRPLVVDTRPIDAQRLALLRRWAAAEPANLEVIVPLASILEQQGDLDAAKSLLMPVRDKLGDGEGARVLGTILGRQGDDKGAYDLLWPYVKTRLDRLHAAEKTADDTVQRLWHEQVKVLQDNQGPRDFYEKYKSAGEERQNAMVREFVSGRIKSDHQFVDTQAALEREAAVVPVALELGIVILHQAQDQSNPDARKQHLEAAEKVFLAVGGIASKTDEYRLALGQVYYWLGKQAEGRKLFDEYLAGKSRSFLAVLNIAGTLRQLGAEGEARTTSEEAYGKGSKPEERYSAALLRSVCNKDLDDQILWLGKADPADPQIKAMLAHAAGEKAYEEGRDDDAVRQYRLVVEAYASMPRSSVTLNEAALAYNEIFRVTGDRAALESCIDYFQQAVELAPSNSILLYNAGATLLGGSLKDVIGDGMDLRALHAAGSTQAMRYLYHDDAGHDALIKRIKDHPGVTRALSYLDKVMLVAPKNARPYEAAYEVRGFTHDDAGLAVLVQRLQAAGIDAADDVRQIKELIGGAKDQQYRAQIATAIKRSEGRTAALRPKGGTTAAYALDELAGEWLSLAARGGTVDAEKILALTQEADRFSSSQGTRAALLSAHLFKGGQEVRRSDPAFDAYLTKYGRHVGNPYLIVLAAGDGGPFQKELLENADVQAAATMAVEDAKFFPAHRGVFDWALLRGANEAEARKAAEEIRQDSRLRVEQTLSNLLHPASVDEAISNYWLTEVNGKPEDGREVLRGIAKLGVPVPIQP